MKYLLNPKMFIIVNIIPVVLLSLIVYNDFYIIKPALSFNTIKLWVNLSSILLVSFLFNLYYLFRKIQINKDISIYFITYNLIFYTYFIFVTSNNSVSLIPDDLPNWMLSSDPIFEVYNFLLPTILLCILIFSSKTIDIINEKNNIKFILFAIFFPFIQIILFHYYSYFFFNQINSKFDTNIAFIFMIVFLILYGYLFLYSLIFFIKKKPTDQINYTFFFKLPFSLVLPIIGMVIFLENLDTNASNWLRTFIILNGIIILIPKSENKHFRLISFILKSITFPISLYIFVIFLPWLPFIPFLLIFLGFGLIVISPIITFLIHIDDLYWDYEYLIGKINLYNLRLIFIISVLIIPIGIHNEFNYDKKNLNEIIDYIYNPNYSKNYEFDIQNIEKTITSIQENKIRNKQSFFNKYPYISNYYNWLVFDNLTLSDTKIQNIKNIFSIQNDNDLQFRSLNIRPISSPVNITNFKVSSKYNSKYEYWESWVDFEITNLSDIQNSEFVAKFDLPIGNYISDYYLYVGNKKEMGQIAEKKSAIWIYSNITSINRDPGIINYISSDKINFRVFPFGAQEVRKTGIQFIHKEDLTLNIDSKIIHLGNKPKEYPIDTNLIVSQITNNEFNENKIHENNDYCYIPAKSKKHLKLVERDFYFHFIIDASFQSDKNNNIRKIENLFIEYPHLKNQSKFTLMGSNILTFDYDSKWKEKILNYRNNGGFYLDRALNSILINNYKENLNVYPKLIVVSNNIFNSILVSDFNNINITFPEQDYYFYINNNNEIETYSLINSYTRVPKEANLLESVKVRLFITKDNSKKYLKDDNNNILIPIFKTNEIDFQDSKNKWEQGNSIKSTFIKLNMNPYLNDKYWKNIVTSSLKNKILSDYTSFIVLENESQRRLLMKKQKESLSGKKALDLGEENLDMSEPNIYILLILIFLLLLIIYLKPKILNLNK